MKLFKFFPLMLLFLALETNSYSQTQKFQYGFFGGAGVTYYRVNYDFGIRGIDTSYNSDLRFTYSLGAFMQYDFAENFGIYAEAKFTKSGGSFASDKIGGSDSLTAVDRTYSSYIDYISLCISPRLSLPVNKDFLFFLKTGGYFSFKIGSTQTTHEETLIQHRDYEKDISDYLKGSDAGLAFGFGFENKIGNNIGILLELKYNFGLTNILDIPGAGDNILMRNNSITLNFGIIGM